MDRNDCKIIRGQLQEVLDRATQPPWTTNSPLKGLTIKVGNARYDDSQVTFKVQIQKAGAESPEVEAYRMATQYASIGGLKADDLGKEFSDMQGRRFTIVGYRQNARTRPILGRDVVSGKEYVFRAADVTRMLRRIENLAEVEASD